MNDGTALQMANFVLQQSHSACSMSREMKATADRANVRRMHENRSRSGLRNGGSGGFCWAVCCNSENKFGVMRFTPSWDLSQGVGTHNANKES